jgi:hypothetical protein
VRTLRADYTPAATVDVALELRPAEAAEGAASLRSLKVTTGSDGERLAGQHRGLDLEHMVARMIGGHAWGILAPCWLY